MLTIGLRLRWCGDSTGRFNWHDLGVFLRATGKGSAIERFRDPEGHDWDTAEYLLANIFDALAGANWQRGGGKSQRPEPIYRPGQKHVEHVEAEQAEPDSIPTIDQSGTYKGVLTPTDELMDWLGWNEEPTLDEQIVEAYTSGEGTYKQLGERFGVSASTVGRIVRANK